MTGSEQTSHVWVKVTAAVDVKTSAVLCWYLLAWDAASLAWRLFEQFGLSRPFAI